MKKSIISFLLLAVCLGAMSQSKSSAAYKPSVSILGDSYSTYADYVEPDTNLVWYPFADARKNNVTKVEETWWHILINRMGYKLCKNNSYSGSTIGYHGYNNEDYRLRSFENRADDLGGPDIILIFGGTNDSWSGTKVGEYKYADWNTEELYTYRPALAKMLEYMKKRYINVNLYFILNSELREDITQSTLEICGHYGIPVIALHDIEKQMGHPSVKGMQEIASQVEAFLKK